MKITKKCRPFTLILPLEKKTDIGFLEAFELAFTRQIGCNIIFNVVAEGSGNKSYVVIELPLKFSEQKALQMMVKKGKILETHINENKMNNTLTEKGLTKSSKKVKDLKEEKKNK
jgi:hypothetical protein